MGIGDWGLGVGDWGVGVGGWGVGVCPNPQPPNPQSPIPNPQSPIPNKNYNFLIFVKVIILLYILINYLSIINLLINIKIYF